MDNRISRIADCMVLEECANKGVDYIDWHITDNKPNKSKRLWILTFDVEENSFYSTLERENVDGGLETCISPLPKKFTQALVQLVL